MDEMSPDADEDEGWERARAGESDFARESERWKVRFAAAHEAARSLSFHASSSSGAPYSRGGSRESVARLRETGAGRQFEKRKKW